jgi:hypothetical protein
MFLPVTTTVKLAVNFPPEVEIHLQGDRAPGKLNKSANNIPTSLSKINDILL